MVIDSVDSLINYLCNSLPNASEGVTFDFDDVNEGVAYITTQTSEFKITIEKINP